MTATNYGITSDHPWKGLTSWPGQPSAADDCGEHRVEVWIDGKLVRVVALDWQDPLMTLSKCVLRMTDRQIAQAVYKMTAQTKVWLDAKAAEMESEDPCWPIVGEQSHVTTIPIEVVP